MKDEEVYQIFIWPSWTTNKKGVIIAKLRGYEGDIHWTGKHEAKHDDSDYDMWLWLYENRNDLPEVLEEAEFKKLYKKSLTSSNSSYSLVK